METTKLILECKKQIRKGLQKIKKLEKQIISENFKMEVFVNTIKQFNEDIK